MIKPLQLPLRAMEKRHLLWWLRYHLYPKGSMSLDSQSSATPYESSSFATPVQGALWTRSIVPHDSIGSIERPILPPE